MPGIRDRNLRSGDLHEELGLFLLRSVALVAPIPRQEDVGNDAFATLIRPEGSRRLIPDVSFLVQLKAASVSEVSYSGPDEIAWITNLEIPLLIGRVDLKKASISLFSTQRVHHILLEQSYDEIRLVFDRGDEIGEITRSRAVNLGRAVHTWSVADLDERDFIARTFSILRPHVESLRQNRLLRDLRYQKVLKWETGQPPTEAGIMMLGTGKDDMKPVLESMIPNVLLMLTEIMHKKRYGDFHVLIALMQLMRKWGVDPDPNGSHQQLAALMARGPEIPDEDVIRLRYSVNSRPLDLSRLQLSSTSLAAIPECVTELTLADTPVSHEGVQQLLRLRHLLRVNLAGTGITDTGLAFLASLSSLEWINVERTEVTQDGIRLLKQTLPNIEVVH